MGEPIRLVNPNDSKSRGIPARLAGSTDPMAGTAEASGPAPIADARPFQGFDLERATYLRSKSGLLAVAIGQFVVIVGEEIEGPLATFDDAERAGYRRFGFGPLYIRQVAAEEPVQEVSRDVFPCRG